MDKNIKSPYFIVKEFVQNNETLPDETQKEYLDCLEELMNNKLPNAEVMESLNNFLNNEMDMVEEAALADHDTDLINKLADLREARTELEKSVFMLYDPNDKNFQESAPEKDKAVQALLSRISTAATS